MKSENDKSSKVKKLSRIKANSFEIVEKSVTGDVDAAILATTKRVALSSMPSFGKKKKLVESSAAKIQSTTAIPSFADPSKITFDLDEPASKPSRDFSTRSTSVNKPDRRQLTPDNSQWKFNDPKPPANKPNDNFEDDPDDTEDNPDYPGYSRAMTKYIENVFSEAHKYPESLPRVELYLEQLFNEAKEKKLERKRRYWESLKLPLFLLGSREASSGRPANTGSQAPASCNIHPSRQIPVSKRSKDLIDGRGDLKRLKADSDTSKPKRAFNSAPETEEEKRKRLRAARFEEMQRRDNLEKQEKAIVRAQAESIQAAVRAKGAEGNPDVLEWDVHTIVGNNQKLEKSYLRLTAPPDPSTVRPLRILERAFAFIEKKWGKERNYTYVCDQFKSMRQDLTVQRIKNAFTVRVYETHARIALEMGDLGEYNQCQSQLKQLYDCGLPGNVDEFTAYRVLYYMHTMNRHDLNALVATEAVKKHIGPYTQYALNVRAAVATGNYHQLFVLYQKKMPIMVTYLFDNFIERERLRACRTICKAYRPSVTVGMLALELGFCSWDPDETERVTRATIVKTTGTKSIDPKTLQKEIANIRQILVEHGSKSCQEWLASAGVTVNATDATIDTKASYSIFDEKYQSIVNKVDIKGQIH